MFLYRHKWSARRAARRKPFQTIDVKGRHWIVRPMTPGERLHEEMNIVMKTIYKPVILAQLNDMDFFRRIRKCA